MSWETVDTELGRLGAQVAGRAEKRRARPREGAFRFSPFSDKQKAVLSWWHPKSPVHDRNGIIADGAIRSGKSVAMSLSFMLWACSTFDGQNFALCGKTIGSFRRNVLFSLKQMLHSRGFTIHDRRTDNLLVVTRGGRTNYFYIFGGTDERSQDLIQGITLAGALFDEVALMPESFVNQATARCSVAGSKWWFNCNPRDPQHWFRKNWIGRCRAKGLLYYHFTLDDNLSLSEEVKARYRSLWTGVFHLRYILGAWVAAEGVIYRDFADSVGQADGRYIWPAGKPLRPWRVHIGVDFGGSGSQHAFVAVGVLPGYAGVVALQSRRVKALGSTPDSLAAAFVQFCDEVFSRWGEIHAVYCDNAEQVLIRGLQVAAAASRLPWLAGRIHDARKAAINDRIQLTAALMSSGRFSYLPEATSLRDALATAVYSGKHPGRDERLDDGSTDIDTLDAFEYAIERDYTRYMRICYEHHPLHQLSE